jgi:hypothetical protein
VATVAVAAPGVDCVMVDTVAALLVVLLLLLLVARGGWAAEVGGGTEVGVETTGA